MDRALRFMVCMGAATVLLVGLASCNQEEVAWETTAGAVGANLADEETFDNRWRSYRVRVGSALEAMSVTLERTREQTSVADRSEIDSLRARIKGLRNDLLSEIDAPRETSTALRAELEDSFDSLRDDVENLLLRLGHSREEFSAWQPTD